MIKVIFYLLLIMVFITAFPSYRGGSAAGQQCRIVQMVSGEGDSLRFLYDSTGKVQSVTETGGYVTSFDYRNNIVVATETKNDSIAYKRLITLGRDGMMINLFEESYEGGSPRWTYRSYTYSDGALSGTTTVNSGRATPLQTTLTWSQGNFIAEKGSNGAGDVRFDYYTDKPAQPGGYWYINVLPVLGMPDRLYRNKNLLKSIRYGKSITNISYEFNKDGRIVSMSKADGHTKIWRYKHECK